MTGIPALPIDAADDLESLRMRDRNASGHAVTYTGIDLPGDLVSMLPALDNLDSYLAEVDPDAVETLAGVRRHAEKYAGPYTIAAFAAYAVAMTCAGGRMPTRRPAPETPRGVELVDVDLAEPVAGSVEAVLPFDLVAALPTITPLPPDER